MPYHYEWLLPKRVIFCYVSGEQSMEEAQQSARELTARLDEGEYPTHYIADLSHNEKMPTTNIKEFKELASFVFHPNLGWVVVVGMNSSMMEYVITVVARITGVRFHPVDTPQQAITFLRQIDSTLDLKVDLDAVVARIQAQSAQRT
jgi:hypothetical protein